MQRILAVAAPVVACSLATAQNAVTYPACQNVAISQTDMDICADAGMKQADADLNAVYQKLLITRSSDTLATAKLKAFERAWITYRNAYLEAAYPSKHKRVEYGSMYPMEYAQVRTKLTREQIQILNALADM